MGTFVLVRHGQSQWNLENRFTGWTDVELTDQGREDAKACAKALADYRFDHVFTSRLMRATETMDIILQELQQTDVPIIYDKALNERNYGDLQGLNKPETLEALSSFLAKENPYHALLADTGQTWRALGDATEDITPSPLLR